MKENKTNLNFLTISSLKTLGTLTMSSHKNRMKGINSILNEENEDKVMEDEN